MLFKLFGVLVTFSSFAVVPAAPDVQSAVDAYVSTTQEARDVELLISEIKVFLLYNFAPAYNSSLSKKPISELQKLLVDSESKLKVSMQEASQAESDLLDKIFAVLKKDYERTEEFERLILRWQSSVKSINEIKMNHVRALTFSKRSPDASKERAEWLDFASRAKESAEFLAKSYDKNFSNDLMTKLFPTEK